MLSLCQLPGWRNAAGETQHRAHFKFAAPAVTYIIQFHSIPSFHLHRTAFGSDREGTIIIDDTLRNWIWIDLDLFNSLLKSIIFYSFCQVKTHWKNMHSYCCDAASEWEVYVFHSINYFSASITPSTSLFFYAASHLTIGCIVIIIAPSSATDSPFAFMLFRWAMYKFQLKFVKFMIRFNIAINNLQRMSVPSFSWKNMPAAWDVDTEAHSTATNRRENYSRYLRVGRCDCDAENDGDGKRWMPRMLMMHDEGTLLYAVLWREMVSYRLRGVWAVGGGDAMEMQQNKLW